jgi:hypothetical protein
VPHVRVRVTIIADIAVMIAVNDIIRNGVNSDHHPRRIPTRRLVPDAAAVGPIITVHIIHGIRRISNDVDAGLDIDERRRLIEGDDLRRADVRRRAIFDDATGAQEAEGDENECGEALHTNPSDMNMHRSIRYASEMASRNEPSSAICASNAASKSASRGGGRIQADIMYQLATALV